eukprot:m.792715 g.792715  ORF g.792715 m.792715 type:complete len:70 (+) comp23332_c1_seq31:559-768(+)
MATSAWHAVVEAAPSINNVTVYSAKRQDTFLKGFLPRSCVLHATEPNLSSENRLSVGDARDVEPAQQAF